MRIEAAEDEAFLRRLFVCSRWRDFSALPEDARRLLLEQQFVLQDRHFRTFHPETDRRIVMRKGEPIGRLYVERLGDRHRLIDIALLPEWCGRGIGGRLIDRLALAADAAGIALELHVAVTNAGARRLYLRKGFRELRLEGADWLMERAPIS